MSTAIVTGSASGIGAAVKSRFEKNGDNVIGIDIKDADIIADLSTKEGRASAISSVGQRCDAIDRLILCAGLATYIRPPSLIVSVNYFGTTELLDGLFDLLQLGNTPAAIVILSNSAQWLSLSDSAYVQALLHHDEAKAIQIIEEHEDIDLAAGIAYVGTKHALGRVVRRRALLWGKAGVRLNAVAPGNTNTPMFQAVMQDPVTGEGVRNMEIPLGRLAEPDEIASLVAFLCCEEAAYIHGGIYYIDGGGDALIRPDSF